MHSLLPLILFAFVSSVTPGPNNIMLASSGIRFGFRRTLPHMAGISAGFAVLLVIGAAGVGSLVIAMPALQVALKTAGSAYLLHLAWQLRNMAFDSDVAAKVQPMSFAGAALFQFANPKAWITSVTGASAFLPSTEPVTLAVLLFCAVFWLAAQPCILLWAGAGALLRHYLAQRRWQLVFCGVMIVATLYAALSIWW